MLITTDKLKKKHVEMFFFDIFEEKYFLLLLSFFKQNITLTWVKTRRSCRNCISQSFP